MNETLLFTEEEWKAAIPGVVAVVTDYLRPNRTAIYEHKGDFGEGWGSGSLDYLSAVDGVWHGDAQGCPR